MRRRLLKALPIALAFGFYMAGGWGLIMSGRWTDMPLQIFLFFAWGGVALLLAMQNAGKPSGHELDMSPWSALLLVGIVATFGAGAYLAPNGRRLVIGIVAAVVWIVVFHAISVIVSRRAGRERVLPRV
jgi:drug/metabolite transporter (DMT)-like permease